MMGCRHGDGIMVQCGLRQPLVGLALDAAQRRHLKITSWLRVLLLPWLVAFVAIWSPAGAHVFCHHPWKASEHVSQGLARRFNSFFDLRLIV